MEKKRICFIAQFPPPMHGLSKAVETLYNSELSNEFELEKIDITNNKKFPNNLIKILNSKADLFYFTISQTRGGNLRDLAILKAIEKRPCLVHLHGGYYRTMIEGLPKWQKNANYKAIAKVSGAIVLGPSLKWIFDGMLPEEKIYTVPNCVDDEYLMSDDEFEEKIESINQKEIKHVLYLSNFIRSKGYPEVLKMAKLEKERIDNGGAKRFHFDFAGNFFEKSEEEFFWECINKYQIKEYITYHGIVSGKKKMDLLKKCDVFSLLTTYPNEGQPISILEAMGNGMVVVTTDHAGISDLVNDKDNGIVLKANTANMPSIIMRRADTLNYKKIFENNRRRVLQLYTQNNYVNNIKNIFINNL